MKKFTGDEGGAFNDIADAAKYTAEYRRLNKPKPGETLIKGHFMGKVELEKLLSHPKAKGIRVYYGINPGTGQKELVFVAADEFQNDILDRVSDHTHPCPQYCSEDNILNS